MITAQELRAIVLGKDAVEMLDAVLRAAAESKQTHVSIECDSWNQVTLTRTFLDAMGMTTEVTTTPTDDGPMYCLYISWS